MTEQEQIEQALDILSTHVGNCDTPDAAVRAWAVASEWIKQPDPMSRPPAWGKKLAKAVEVGLESAHAACRPVGRGMLRRNH